MDFFQGVVVEYLRADRGVFVNPELLIQLDKGDSLGKGRHWYCDAAAASFKEKTVFLCGISYSQTLSTLLKRLQSWADNWADIKKAMVRNAGIPSDWQILPWVFIPMECRATFDKKVVALTHGKSAETMSEPRISYLESVVPWKYRRTWDRREAAIENGD